MRKYASLVRKHASLARKHASLARKHASLARKQARLVRKHAREHVSSFYASRSSRSYFKERRKKYEILDEFLDETNVLIGSWRMHILRVPITGLDKIIADLIAYNIMS